MMPLPIGAPDSRQFLNGPDLVILHVAPSVGGLPVRQSTPYPILSVACVEDEHGAGILRRQIGKQLIALEICPRVIEILHVGESVELLVSSQQIQAVGEIGKHALRQPPAIPVDTAYPVGLQIMM